MRGQPVLFVTNFNRNFTGVSATAAAILPHQMRTYDLRLVGKPLPGLSQRISVLGAYLKSARRPDMRPFAIWHVRRNNEMQAALFARDILRLPIKVVFTSAAQRKHKRWPSYLISKMDAVIATTELAAKIVPNTTLISPHGVDTQKFRPALDRAAAWRATGFAGQRGVATVGRIRPEKGTDRFVRTMIQALPDLPDTTALVIGQAKPEHADFLSGLRAEIAAAGLTDRILFPGEVSAKDMPDLVRALSLLVAFPRYEGYGLTPIEAMASAVPVVANDEGHYSAFVGDGEAGIIVPSDDPVANAKIIHDLLTDTEHFEKIAASARTRAKTHFSIESEVANITKVYEQLWQETDS